MRWHGPLLLGERAGVSLSTLVMVWAPSTAQHEREPRDLMSGDLCAQAIRAGGTFCVAARRDPRVKQKRPRARDRQRPPKRALRTLDWIIDYFHAKISTSAACQHPSTGVRIRTASGHDLLPNSNSQHFYVPSCYYEAVTHCYRGAPRSQFSKSKGQ